MPTNTYVALDTTTLVTATPSITFSNISQEYTDLVLVANIAQEAGNNSLRYRFNNDSGSNYSATYLIGNGSNPSSNREPNITSAYVATTGSTTLETNFILHIMNYSNSTTYKTAIGRGNRASAETDATVGLWRNTAAITTISFALGSGFPTNNFAANSTFSLYGIKSWSDEVSPKATGGYVSEDSSYWYHTFPFSSTFTPNQSLTADYLVVGGGGGAGPYGGGGGAGGFRTFTSQSLTANTDYTVVVGAGGLGSGTSSTGGSNGTASSFNGSTAGFGGGGGSGETSSAAGFGKGQNGGATNGSGGGSGYFVTTGGTGDGTGGNGGGGINNTGYPSGGGGGASANGASASGKNGGAGGNGTYTAISGGAATGLGQLSGGNYYFAGGGGGGAGNPVGSGVGTAGTGGLGGGGNGGQFLISNGSNATANTGGGGGGAGGTTVGNVLATGGNGGSGVVIVRYAK